MPTFSILRGPTALCTADLESGEPTLHPRAHQRERTLVVEETDKLGFRLNPAPEGIEYRLLIGDIPLSDLVAAPQGANGLACGGQLFWPEGHYFESARGETSVCLEAKPEQSATEAWKPILALPVYVLPSKLGESRYQGMADDLREVSRGLLLDLYGKSKQTHDVRFSREARAHQSREQELASIEGVLDRLAVLLQAIGQRPASGVRTVLYQHRYWGGERLTPGAINAMCRRGSRPRAGDGPVRIQGRRKVESFDIAEHRVARAFLEILVRRTRYCAEIAQGHMNAIAAERHLRHIRFGSGTTLYELEDVPRIKRLQEALRMAERAVSTATTLANLPFLRDVQAELVAVRGGAFQRSAEYQSLLAVMRRFLLANAVWYEGDETSVVTKLTWRLFEQWCYLRIIEAFRRCGLELREWTQALRENLQSRFVLDFDRGLTFEGLVTADLRLRFRYEPWIRGAESAAKVGETLCRGSATETAWCPDVVIECLRSQSGVWRPVYGIVLDAKYTTAIKNHHWENTAKYLEIRSTEGKRQIVKQLWLIAPSARPSIRSEDPAVTFGETGPSCGLTDVVRFGLLVQPASPEIAKAGGSGEPDLFDYFARGTLRFLQRELG